MYGIHEDGFALRSRIARFIRSNPDMEISGTPLKLWIEWDSRMDVTNYASQLAAGRLWGGAIEMAACAHIYSVDVAVYEDSFFSGLRGYNRISDFATEESPIGAVLLLYSGRSHYDAIHYALSMNEIRRSVKSEVSMMHNDCQRQQYQNQDYPYHSYNNNYSNRSRPYK